MIHALSGSMSDGQIWNNCDFGTTLDAGTADLPDPKPLPGGDEPIPCAFVGDEAFGLKPYMMRPFSKPKKRRGFTGNQAVDEHENSDPEGCSSDERDPDDPAPVNAKRIGSSFAATDSPTTNF